MKKIKIKAIEIKQDVVIIGIDLGDNSPYYISFKNNNYITQYTKSEMMECFGLTYPDIDQINEYFN